MEFSLTSLAFRGSITEAVVESKQQKKLFVVYISGDNPDSKLLETSTWIDPKVSETVSKYCILLHISEGSSEALNFSAIYPQQSCPCITAVGYNGVLLWQKEGYVPADLLASSLEKAWLSLHVQTASGSSEVASPEQVRAGTHVSTSTTYDATPSVGAAQLLHSETKEIVNSNKDASEGTYSKGDDIALPKPAISGTETNSGSTSGNPVEIAQKKHKDALPVAEKNSDVDDRHLSCRGEIIKEASQVARANTEDIAVEKTEASTSTTKSNDVSLNIRLPDGSSLQVKLLMTDTLRMVRDYINENQTSSLGSFSIAIPYPRKVFNDQEMDSTLSELGLSNRQALVVVPQKQNNSQYRGGSSQNQNHSSNEAGSSSASEGYWGSVKRILSYANVFSYLGRSDSTSVARESQSGMWQYSPLQNPPRDGGRVSGMQSSEQSAPSATSGSNSRRRPLTSNYGGNIHTLKHDEDDDRFNDKNAFWNGNSTQFGGNDDRK
ncbi:plant UBX domain-containing protein 11 isoform X2 [Salvia hispanica]|uniref:plant UBX domain-containing protein 11 isoform X2 n=1 Tax=Salvia hispanica TaxID=49212 RepID=UPI002008F80D|nr:plant UBX domain-containing protein 11 isoform X2 [Salvia hispanica]